MYLGKDKVFGKERQTVISPSRTFSDCLMTYSGGAGTMVAIYTGHSGYAVYAYTLTVGKKYLVEATASSISAGVIVYSALTSVPVASLTTGTNISCVFYRTASAEFTCDEENTTLLVNSLTSEPSTVYEIE